MGKLVVVIFKLSYKDSLSRFYSESDGQSAGQAASTLAWTPPLPHYPQTGPTPTIPLALSVVLVATTEYLELLRQ